MPLSGIQGLYGFPTEALGNDDPGGLPRRKAVFATETFGNDGVCVGQKPFGITIYPNGLWLTTPISRLIVAVGKSSAGILKNARAVFESIRQTFTSSQPLSPSAFSL